MNERLQNADITRILAHMKEHVMNLTGKDQAAGLQIAGLIRILANQYDKMMLRPDDDELSGPRMGVLVRLMEEDRRGNHGGITPTDLSYGEHVSRNTISALLRGLEEQGLIERQLDPTDLRLFRIRLTEAGRTAVETTAPPRIDMASQMIAGLTPDEQDQLIELLSKLFVSLQSYSCKKKA